MAAKIIVGFYMELAFFLFRFFFNIVVGFESTISFKYSAYLVECYKLFNHGNE